MNIADKKEEKRIRITNSAKELFLKNSIKNVSIKNIAKKADVALGTVYLYFKNKDELLFEIFKIISHSQFEKVTKEMPNKSTLKEKLLLLFSYYLDNDSDGYVNLFSDFYTTCITNNYINKEQGDFITNDYNELFDFIKKILIEAIEEKEIKYTDSHKLAKAICASIDGMFFYSIMVQNFDLKYEIDNYFDTMIDALKSTN